MTWNIAAQGAGGGGIAASAALPGYQSGVDMSKNSGSTANCNLPDVWAVATNLSVAVTNPTTGVQRHERGAIGSSAAAAPLWAAFVALANQQAQNRTGNLHRHGRERQCVPLRAGQEHDRLWPEFQRRHFPATTMVRAPGKPEHHLGFAR